MDQYLSRRLRCEYCDNEVHESGPLEGFSRLNERGDYVVLCYNCGIKYRQAVFDKQSDLDNNDFAVK